MKPPLLTSLFPLLVTTLLVGCGPNRPGKQEMDKAHSPATLPDQPEDWPTRFTERLNSGDVEGVIALYEPDARFVTPSGETIVGHAAMRRVVVGLVEAKTRFNARVVKVVEAGDVAVLYTDFHGITVEPFGEKEIHQKAIEVLRRQPDGTWKLIVGDPNGRAR
jgi:uncharacterized protein (TIGR02246 family)